MGDRKPADDRHPHVRILFGDQPKRLPVQLCGVDLRPPALLLLRGGDEVVDRAAGITRISPVTPERGPGLADLGGRLLEKPRALLVELATARAGSSS